MCLASLTERCLLRSRLKSVSAVVFVMTGLLRAKETQLSAILWSIGLIFDCSDSVCSLRPTPFSYLCVHVRILGVLKIVCCWANKTRLLTYACCGLHFYGLRCLCPVLLRSTTPLHIYIYRERENTWGLSNCMRGVYFALIFLFCLCICDLCFNLTKTPNSFLLNHLPSHTDS